MKHPEDYEADIAKVIGGLREAEPPQGLEQRVLRSVQHRAAAPRTTWLALPGSMRPLVYGLALAGVVAVGIASFMVRRAVPAPAPVAAQAPQSVARPSAPLTAVVAPTPVPPHPRSSVKRRKTEDALARSEMLAISHPAPPMPLTEQERLLLRIAHTGDPQELAALNPEMRERQLAMGDAEFHAFFPPQIVHQ